MRPWVPPGASGDEGTGAADWSGGSSPRTCVFAPPSSMLNQLHHRTPAAEGLGGDQPGARDLLSTHQGHTKTV